MVNSDSANLKENLKQNFWKIKKKNLKIKKKIQREENPGYIKIASIWRENMLGYLSANIICSE